ncbi:MAG: hypothetical protein MJK12_18080 [Colwellia sp.]|nr:hypothetical protein [Colwellia sp.]
MAWVRKTKPHMFLWRFVRQEYRNRARKDKKWIPFEQGGTWNNSFIIRAAVSASPAMVKQNAEDFARKADAFIMEIGAKKNKDDVGNDISRDDAISKLTEAFAVPDSKLSSMGDIMTECYIVE